MGQAQLSRCRHTADKVAGGSGRLPSEGGWVVAAADVRSLGRRTGQGREETGGGVGG